MGPMQKFLRTAHGQDDDLRHRPDYWLRGMEENQQDSVTKIILKWNGSKK